jgi:hypothetical protein
LRRISVTVRAYFALDLTVLVSTNSASFGLRSPREFTTRTGGLFLFIPDLVRLDSDACLFKALQDNLAIVRAGKKDKSEAVAIAWVLHLVGDLHQPLHMAERLRGGNGFHVTYRGKAECKNFQGRDTTVELHSAWDDCLVEELANGRDPKTLARDILGDVTSFRGRPEIGPGNNEPWLTWGDESHVLSNSVAFDSLPEGADVEDGYVKGKGKALDVVQRQLLTAGIRLAFLLDENFE